MDWIEKLIGIEPDGGNGMLEAAIMICLVTAVVLVALRSTGRRRGWSRRFRP